MDKFGNGMLIQYCDLPKTKELCFTNFTQQMVLEMCIFSGCDYLPSLPGMGVKRAHALMKRFKNFQKVRSRSAALDL
jgi:exonuclease-1